MPPGDVLVHCGDFVQRATHRSKYEDFNDWLGELPYKHAVVIAGNHEYAFNRGGEQKMPLEEVRELLSNAHYLQDSAVDVMGLRFWGSPWQTSRGMAFSESREDLPRRWDGIPDGVDVCLTHMPPKRIRKAAGCPPIEHEPDSFRYLDLADNGKFWGCSALRDTLLSKRGSAGDYTRRWRHRSDAPRVAVCGHVHEGYGYAHVDDTTFINAAQKEYFGRFLRGPIVFDIAPRHSVDGDAVDDAVTATTVAGGAGGAERG